MANWLIIGVGAVYFYISVESFCVGNKARAIIFFGYAFSNIGLWLAEQ